MNQKITLSEYPRPQLKRDSYLCLNGEWEYAIRDRKDIPPVFDGKIIVPFSPETELSGVNKMFYLMKIACGRRASHLDQPFY